MIIRVFRATVEAAKIAEFEDKYQTVSVPFMQSCDGMEYVSIGRSVVDAADAYVMVSKWRSTDHLAQALGQSWDKPHIPSGMEHLIVSCTVEHYHEMSVWLRETALKTRQAGGCR